VIIFTGITYNTGMWLVITILAVFLVLVGNEIWWRRQKPHDEFSRKFVHITVGSFVAFWPFFLTWTQIEILSVAFLIVIGLSRWLGVFQAIHSVQRPTWGEVFFALAVGLLALITHDKWIYAVSLLQMSVADGMAAVVGTRFSGQHKYAVLGHAKSVIGTLTFFAVSLVVLLVLNQYLPHQLSLMEIMSLSALASLIENIGIMGLDNLLVPCLVALVLVHA
jgi:phytol kinase